MTPRTKDTCDSYQRQLEAGGKPTEIVAGLAAYYNVNRPAIWQRLRRGGVLPPYRSTGVTRIRRPKQIEANADRDSRPRVSRDPCPRCGTRGDLDCGHSKNRIGTAFSNA